MDRNHEPQFSRVNLVVFANSSCWEIFKAQFEACIRHRALQSLRSRESQLDEKENVFSMDAE